MADHVMADQVARLSFPAKADYLLLARLALSGIARDVDLDAELLADLKLAVTEACGNAIRHAYPGSSGAVAVAFVIGTDRLQMVVEDQGTGIAPDALSRVEPIDAGGLPEGEMGMSIIRAIVDELDVTRGADDRGTVVRMTKYLSAAGSPGA
jgi:serine/threonine-protein kinase RsbW